MLSADLDQLSQLAKRLRLAEGLAARKGDPGQQRVLLYLRRQIRHIHQTPAVEGMGLRIVTARAVMGTPLGEYREADTRPIHDGLGYDAANSQLGGHA